MSLADKIFIDMCKDVIENGTSTEGEKVRPVWEDGTSAYTIKRFGVVNRYDLRKEFPALTLRRTALKSAMDEILWIWQKKSNKISFKCYDKALLSLISNVIICIIWICNHSTISIFY